MIRQLVSGIKKGIKLFSGNFAQAKIRFVVSILICLHWTSLYAAIPGIDGLLGYANTPSAQPLAQGGLIVSGNSIPHSLVREPGNTQTQYNAAWIMSPIENLELGMILRRIENHDQHQYEQGSLSLKFSLPRAEIQQPILSFGVADLANPRTPFRGWFFVARKEWLFDQWLVGVDAGSIYYRNSKPFDVRNREADETVHSFVNMNLDIGVFELQVENIYDGNSLKHYPAAFWRPWYQGTGTKSNHFSVGGGYNPDQIIPEKVPDLWFSANIQMNLEPFRDTLQQTDGSLWVKKTPMIVWETGPDWQHDTRNGLEYRFIWRNDVITRTWIDRLYWVNGFELPLIESDSTQNLPHTAFWSRSFMAWRPLEKEISVDGWRIPAPSLSLGLLESYAMGGLLTQEIIPPNWDPIELAPTYFYSRDFSEKDFGWRLKAPVHPKIQGFWNPLQLSVQGGKNLFHRHWAEFDINWKTSRGEISLFAGYEDSENPIIAGINTKTSLRSLWGWDLGPLRIQGTNRLERRNTVKAGGKNVEWTAGISPWFRTAPWKMPVDTTWQELPEASCDPEHNSWEQVSQSAICGAADYDGDGVPNNQDACPEAREDMDDFQDSDGCPDHDNDNDGISDIYDACPMEAEDPDGFQQSDGCPEPDNDQDGFMDEVDSCPNAKEDIDGFEDTDGCPDPDNDQDGISDVLDKCPMEAEDFNGIADKDGCPDGEDDDRLPEPMDACPAESEDYDRYEDLDGCPDPDNDSDGIPDYEDSCPNSPETMNGRYDQDGCPD